MFTIKLNLGVNNCSSFWAKGRKACNVFNGHLNWGFGQLDFGDAEWNESFSFGNFAIYSEKAGHVPFFNHKGERGIFGAYIQSRLGIDEMFLAGKVRINNGPTNGQLYAALISGRAHYLEVKFTDFDISLEVSEADEYGSVWAEVLLVEPLYALVEGCVPRNAIRVGYDENAAKAAVERYDAMIEEKRKALFANAKYSFDKAKAIKPKTPSSNRSKANLDDLSL